ncbi:hypothetical protein PHLH6_07790 [Pseudomonas sp. Seg1]|uniref:hypothetical protein n=1 Tax=unclassified Pseudomonas TaxID=196821 RepID=UPI000CCFE25E|nr:MULTISPECIES: hypothetical protein [unclassified Pseudomonas]POA49367.1 hypothetical protein C1893_07015 [Pseudomonas sp. MPR-ANC1]BBP68775.1 hypothetical protein PHLH6_07790 [Pseudomonas sp. Seg1]
MKRSVLLGLFVTASIMASSSFAADKPESLCEANLQTIDNAKAQYQTSPDLNSRVSASVSKARALKAQGKIDECLAETQQIILEIQKTTGNTNK